MLRSMLASWAWRESTVAGSCWGSPTNTTLQPHHTPQEQSCVNLQPEPTDRQTDRQTDGRSDKQIDKWMD